MIGETENVSYPDQHFCGRGSCSVQLSLSTVYDHYIGNAIQYPCFMVIQDTGYQLFAEIMLEELLIRL